MKHISSDASAPNYSADRSALPGSSPIETSGPPATESGVELGYPARAASLSRLGHVPFLFWIVDALRPRVIVELGVDAGNSYCAFLQATSQLGLDIRCFGVDPWPDRKGDESYQELCNYHDPLYGAFSTLLRSPYDAAASHFGDGTIDLLHIDGVREYDAVSHDFRTWLPKMSSRGVVLMHGTAARAAEYGAWQILEEARARHPVFEFVHSGGLGIACVGSEPLPGSLKFMFEQTPISSPNRIRTYFARLGVSVEEHIELRDAEARISSANLRIQLAEGKLARADEARRESEKALHEAKAEIDKASADRTRNKLGSRHQLALVTRLQREVAVLNRHKLEWEQISRSKLWRMTAPLRWLAIRFRWLIWKLSDRQIHKR